MSVYDDRVVNPLVTGEAGLSNLISKILEKYPTATIIHCGKPLTKKYSSEEQDELFKVYPIFFVCAILVWFLFSFDFKFNYVKNANIVICTKDTYLNKFDILLSHVSICSYKAQHLKTVK